MGVLMSKYEPHTRIRRHTESGVFDLKQMPGADVDDLTTIVDGGNPEALKTFLAILHPADLAELFEILDKGRWIKVIKGLNTAQISDLMEELPDHLRDDLAELLRPGQLTRVIGEMASDDAADVLADLPERMAHDLIESLPEEDRAEVTTLLRYPEDTAGGLMQMELVAVPDSATVSQAVDILREEAADAGDFHFIYVVNDEGGLVGVLKLETLILARDDDPVRELMSQPRYAVTPDVDQEQVGFMFKRYDLVSLAVVDENGVLLGRILHDDAVDVLEEEADEDMLHMAGANPDDPELVYTDRLFKIASVRLPWLLVTLAGLTVPALLVWAFQVSFPHILALVPFVPVIGAMGGNVGTQSTTIVVRGFATGRVDFHNLGVFLGRELFISALMGVACGLLSGIVALVWHRDFMLCLTVGLSMTLAIIASAILGVLVPYLFRLVRIDPAIAAGPAVTTIDDIVAIAIYYLAALALLK